MTNKSVSKLAEKFHSLVRYYLADRLYEIDTLNRVNNDYTCATHNFYDANVIMAEAFEDCFDYEIDPNNEADTLLWNSAWSLAKNYGFNNGNNGQMSR